MFHPSLASFHPMVAEWFTHTFGSPTPPQIQGWPRIAAGENVLLLAPTGSGKTLAAFLKCLDWLYQEYEAKRDIDDGVKVLYISPLKALNNDIHCNLELPLKGISEWAAVKGISLPVLWTAVRSGDTLPQERQRMLRKPPHILITTPESLFLMLSSKGANILRNVRFVIIDEIHALFPTKRGAHLSICLERLENINERQLAIQRIGLSATMKPLSEAAAFLGGAIFDSNKLSPRPVQIIDTGQRKQLELQIKLPVENLTDLPDKTIWPSIYRQLLEAVNQHRTTLIFVNNRRLAERITTNLNELAGKTVAMTHHGSISKEVRLMVEDKLKTGEIPCIVATSSLELGIDIGYIDVVIQIESPKEVARGLQRVGRAGHVIHLPSKGWIIPKTRSDLLEAVVIFREMKAGRVEESRAPFNCLDILAQQLVAMTVQKDWPIEEMYHVIRGAYNYQTLTWRDFENTLSMLTGNYSTAEFVELRPRLYWDRHTGKVSADPYGKQLVYSSGGTIPDRGYFGVYLSGQGTRLGELDEEFVYERRLNERFVLGTSTWRIEEIRRDRVIVTPSNKGGDVNIPFWKAEQNGRSYELGKRFGAFLAEVESRVASPECIRWFQDEVGISENTAQNLRDYLLAQKKATEFLPTDRRLILEEFPDEIGEWKVVLHSPFGLKTHTVLGLLIKEAWESCYKVVIQDVPTDDGIIFHCPGGEKPPAFPFTELTLDDLESKIAELISDTPLFGVTFRHAAQRSLVLPRGAYGRKRNPLWLSRLKAGNLLQTVSKYSDFPLIIETYREIMQNYFDLDGVKELISAIQKRQINIHQVRRSAPSPFVYPHLFSLINNYMYDSDAPRGERNLQLFGMGYETLQEIVGVEGYREILDQNVIDGVIRHLQGLDLIEKNPAPERILFWLERIGDIDPRALSSCFLSPDVVNAVFNICNNLIKTGQIYRLALENQTELYIAAKYAPEYLCGMPNSVSIPDIQLNPEQIITQNKAVNNIIRRYARFHGPFKVSNIHSRYGFDLSEIETILNEMLQDGTLKSGQFLPGQSGVEWCETNFLTEIHRRSLAVARQEIEPKSYREFTSFLARRHYLIDPVEDLELFGDILDQLSYLWLPAYLWEQSIFPARSSRYSPNTLDQFIASGQYRWRIRGNHSHFELQFEPIFWENHIGLTEELFPSNSIDAETETDSVSSKINEEKLSSVAQLIIEILSSLGALSLPQILAELSAKHQIASSLTAWQGIEELVFSGKITNDSFGPVRYLLNTRSEDLIGAKGVLRPSVIAQMGRWSLLPQEKELPISGQASILLKRYGIVCKEIAQAEGFNWNALYQVFDILEKAGKIRRGYFIHGLSGIQYARSETLDALRSPILTNSHWAINRLDPANALKFFPENKVDSDFLVYSEGELIWTATAGKKIKLQALLKENESNIHALRVLFGLMGHSCEKITIASINGKPVINADDSILTLLTELGFEKGYKEMTLWESRKLR